MSRMRPAMLLGIAVSLALLATACATKKSDWVSDPKKRSEAAQINMQLGIDYFRQGDLQQAKDKLDRSLDQDPRNAMTHMAAGLLYDRLGEADKAEKHFERAVDLDPKNPDIRNNYAVFLCRHDKYERGEKQALAAITDPLYKTPEAALYNAGNCARNGGDAPRAELYFRRALSLSPRFAPALLDMAGIDFQNKNYLAARGFLERYMAAQTPTPAALLLAIKIEHALGNRAMEGDYARRLTSEYPTADETRQYLEASRASK